MMYMWKPNVGWVNITEFCFLGINPFPRFDMVVEAQPLLKMWYNDIKRDHRRALNKYVGALSELININGWHELIEVLTCY